MERRRRRERRRVGFLITVERIVDGIRGDELVDLVGAELVASADVQHAFPLQHIQRIVHDMVGTLLAVGTLVWSDEWHDERADLVRGEDALEGN